MLINTRSSLQSSATSSDKRGLNRKYGTLIVLHQAAARSTARPSDCVAWVWKKNQCNYTKNKVILGNIKNYPDWTIYKKVIISIGHIEYFSLATIRTPESSCITFQTVYFSTSKQYNRQETCVRDHLQSHQTAFKHRTVDSVLHVTPAPQRKAMS